MRKKSGFIPIAIGIEQAIVLVTEFEKVVRKLEQQVTLHGSEQKVKKRSVLLFIPKHQKLSIST